jgi:hypothetical protein
MMLRAVNETHVFNQIMREHYFTQNDHEQV